MFLGEKTYFGLSFCQNIKIQQNFLLMSAFFRKIQNFDHFIGFCSPEFDLFMKDSAIFRLKCNEQHFSIPKGQIKTLARFYNEIKLDLQTYAKPSISLSKNIDDVIVTS